MSFPLNYSIAQPVRQSFGVGYTAPLQTSVINGGFNTGVYNTGYVQPTNYATASYIQPQTTQFVAQQPLLTQSVGAVGVQQVQQVPLNNYQTSFVSQPMTQSVRAVGSNLVQTGYVTRTTPVLSGVSYNPVDYEFEDEDDGYYVVRSVRQYPRQSYRQSSGYGYQSGYQSGYGGGRQSYKWQGGKTSANEFGLCAFL